MKRIALSALAALLFTLMTCPAQAADNQTEFDKAVSYMQDSGIMTGDENGDLHLDDGLSRAELAVLLTRLCNGITEMQSNFIYYSQSCKFSDVPAWVMPYVGYCVRNNLISGYDALHYGAADPVTPAMACTVVFRACGMGAAEGSAWSYATVCSYAVEHGLLDVTAARLSGITRGEMALLIYRTLNGATPTTPHTEAQAENESCLANGKPVAEENVLELLQQIEKEWPAGTIWGTHNTPGTHKNEIPSTVSNRIMNTYKVSGEYGCGAYASMVSTLVFGDKPNPARRVEDLTQIRPGDILFFVRNSDGYIWHIIVALESPSEIHAFHYTDGNNGQKVYWPDQKNPYGRENLDCFGVSKEYHLEAWTRYPESVPYSGNSIGAWPTGT